MQNLLGMSAQVVVGTSLLQILFVTMVTTIVHATTTRSVDIVLAGLLHLLGLLPEEFAGETGEAAAETPGGARRRPRRHGRAGTD